MFRFHYYPRRLSSGPAFVYLGTSCPFISSLAFDSDISVHDSPFVASMGGTRNLRFCEESCPVRSGDKLDDEPLTSARSTSASEGNPPLDISSLAFSRVSTLLATPRLFLSSFWQLVWNPDLEFPWEITAKICRTLAMLVLMGAAILKLFPFKKLVAL